MPSSPSPDERRRDHDDYEMTMTKLGVGCHLTKYNNQNSGQSVSRRGGREKGRGRGDVKRLCGIMTTPSSPSPDERQQDHDDDKMTMMRLGVGGPRVFWLVVGKDEKEEDEVFWSVIERRLTCNVGGQYLIQQSSCPQLQLLAMCYSYCYSATSTASLLSHKDLLIIFNIPYTNQI